MIEELQQNVQVQPPLVTLKNVQKVFQSGGKDFVAVKDVTLTIEAGDLLSIVGPSGCGKTTVLKILAGLYDASGGSVQIGPEGAGSVAGHDVGMVFQQPLLLKWRSIIDNVLLPADILGLPRKEVRERAHDLLAMVGLKDAADKYPYQLSGGMQQRAAIARALIHDPKLVLMDEPFGALDAITREKMNLELLRIREQSNKTFIVVTHGIQEAVFLGSHCAVLSAGPARMADYFAIDIDYPRPLSVKTSPKFGAYVERIYDKLDMSA